MEAYRERDAMGRERIVYNGPGDVDLFQDGELVGQFETEVDAQQHAVELEDELERARR